VVSFELDVPQDLLQQIPSKVVSHFPHCNCNRNTYIYHPPRV